MASSPITSWEMDGETVETVADFIFGDSKITADGDCSHEIKRRLLLGKKVMAISFSLSNFSITFFLVLSQAFIKCSRKGSFACVCMSMCIYIYREREYNIYQKT